jgi:hypothetical protein
VHRKAFIPSDEKGVDDWGLRAEQIAEAFCVHPSSIKPIFYGYPMDVSFQGGFRA